MPADSLGIIIEFAIGLAGFAGIAVSVGDPAGSAGLYERHQLRSLLVAAFGAALVAFVALGLLHSGFSETRAWFASSAACLAYTVAMWIFIARTHLALPLEQRATTTVWRGSLFLLVSVVSVVVQAVNLSGGFGSRGFAAVYFGLVCLLAHGALQFIWILLARGRG